MKLNNKYIKIVVITICLLAFVGCISKEKEVQENSSAVEETAVEETAVEEFPSQVDEELIAAPSPAAEAAIVKGQEYIAHEWGTDLPENHGIQQEWLDEFAYAIQERPVRAVLIVRDGSIIYENYWEGFHKDSQFEMYSCAKSMTSAAVGIALEQGYLTGVKSRLGEFFPNIENEDMKKITIEQLLNFTSGIEWPESVSDSVYWDWLMAESQVEYVLHREVKTAPGEVFNYSSGNSHLVSAILTQVTGVSEEEYLEENLFGPMGIDEVVWWADSQGITFGGFGICMRARDAARFGQLYLNEGKWGEQQLIPAEWVRVSTMSQGANEYYGYNWWIDPSGPEQLYDMYHAAGYGGQYIFVVPKLQLTAVIMSEGVEDLAVVNRFCDLLNKIE